MPKISEAQRESRRRQILDAALRCFSRDGFHNTTTADIVRESGVSQGTLYLYFENKDEIVAALADDRHQGEAYLNALAQSEPDPVQGLALLLNVYGRTLLDGARSDQRRVGVQGWAEALRDPMIKASIIASMTSVREAIVRLVARGQASGQIKASVDADAFARLLTATFQGLILHTCWDEPVDIAAIGTLLADMIRGALFTEGAQATRFEPKGETAWP